MFSPTQRARRLLPAYHHGQLSARGRRWLEQHLQADPALARESEAVAELARVLRANDPASPPDLAAREALKAHLAGEVTALRAAGAPAVWRPVFATALAGLLFSVGCFTGARAFPRQVVKEVIQVQRVEVPVEKRVEVPMRVEVPVIQRVEVPVTREVVRYRARAAAPRPAGASADTTDSPAEDTAPPARHEAPAVVRLDPGAGRAGVGVAAAPSGSRPSAVDF